MSLEQDIHQETFRNQYQKAIINILFTENYLVTRMTDVFKDFDITRQQYNVLRILRGQFPEPATINLIKDRMLDKMSDSSRIVERLRAKDLVERADGRTDKRSVEITISHKGLELLKEMQPKVNDLEKLLHNLSVEETRDLNFLLDKIRSAELQTEKISHTLELLSQAEKF
jgi:DNA-binding MarR family transcriptional regulator